MPQLHAKFHQNWWSGFWVMRWQDTEGHSFIIIRIRATKTFFYYSPKDILSLNSIKKSVATPLFMSLQMTPFFRQCASYYFVVYYCWSAMNTKLCQCHSFQSQFYNAKLRLLCDFHDCSSITSNRET